MSTSSFQSRYYTSPDGLRLHYREYAGPPSPRFTVICIPGLTRNASDFEDLAPHLARTYRVLCVELRGRGQSEYAKDPMTYVPPVYVRDVAALFDALQLKQAALIGTSLGGIVSMVLSSIMPHKILGVILNDIGPELNPEGLARIGSYVGKTKSMKTWEEAAAAIRELDGKIFPDYLTDDVWLRMARRRFIEDEGGGLRPNYDLNIAKPFAANNDPVDLWPFLSAMKNIPTMAIRGANSDLLKPEIFARMKETLPHLVQVTVPNRGHAPHLDEPQALSAIDEFLRGLPANLTFTTRVSRQIAGLVFMAKLKAKGIA